MENLYINKEIIMPRKKKTEETKEEIKETKKDNINPYGWNALRNKAKFTRTK